MNLTERLGVGERELVAFVGAGGKSTLLLQLGAELVEEGRRVIVTTTTKLGSDQVAGTVCTSTVPATVDQCLAESDQVFVFIADDGRKVTGPAPEDVDRLFAETSADYVLVEADGARRRSIKAPAAHEPVIPPATTVVVVVASLDAIGRPLFEVAHRPELVSGLLELGLADSVRPADVVALLASPQGGMKGVPDDARVVVALTGVRGSEHAAGATRSRRPAAHRQDCDCPPIA